MFPTCLPEANGKYISLRLDVQITPTRRNALWPIGGIISNFILAALWNRQFLPLLEPNEAIWEQLIAFNYKALQICNQLQIANSLPPRSVQRIKGQHISFTHFKVYFDPFHLSVHRIIGCGSGPHSWERNT